MIQVLYFAAMLVEQVDGKWPRMPMVTGATISGIAEAFSLNPGGFMVESMLYLGLKDAELLNKLISFAGTNGVHDAIQIFAGGAFVWRMLYAQNPNLPPSYFSAFDEPVILDPSARQAENIFLMEFIASTEEKDSQKGALRKIGGMTVYEWKRATLLEPNNA